MQATTVCFTGPITLRSTKNLVPRRSTAARRTFICSKAISTATPDASTVDYSSSASVFPAEACETIGGTACEVQMFPEVKLNPTGNNMKESDGPEEVDREYLEYTEPKTVFPSEACDDLGGEFCEPEYQKGVY